MPGTRNHPDTTCPALRHILPHSKEVVANLLAAADLPPPHARDIDDTDDPGAVPPLVGEEALQLVVVDVLVPVVRASRDDAQQVLGHEVGRKPARPRTCDGAHDEPTAGLDERVDLSQERGRLVDVLEDLKDGDDVVALAGAGDRHLLDRALAVGQLSAEGGVLPGVCFGDGEDGGRGVDGGDAPRGRQPGGALCKDAPAAADVEVGETLGPRVELGGEARVDEVVAEGVHEVEDAGGTVRIPPLSSEGIEVGYLFGVDGGEGWRRRR